MKTEKEIKEGQLWFISRMQELGYKIDREGLCYGIACVGMNAFFADDIFSFEQRLKNIASLPINFFQNNFALLKIQQRELLEAGVIEKALSIQQTITDILAFFDSVTFLQDPKTYRYLIPSQDEQSVAIVQKNSVLFDLVMPIVFSNYPEMRPTKLSEETIGGYTKEELLLYLKLMEQYIGVVPFSVMFSLDYHALNLSYDPKTHQWIVVDANRLPPRKYQSMANIVEDIFDGKPAGITLGTTIFVAGKNHLNILGTFHQMQQDKAYLSLHDSVKAENGYQGYREGHYFDVLTANGFPPTEKMLLCICAKPSRSSLSKIKYYLSHGATPSIAMLEMACHGHAFEIAQFIIERGIKPTNDSLPLFITKGDLVVLDFLLKNDVIPNELDLDFACFVGNLNAIKFLIPKHLMANANILETACRQNDVAMVEFLLKQGTMPTNELLDEIVEKQQIHIMDVFRQANIKFPQKEVELLSTITPADIEPTVATLENACCRGDLLTVKSIIERGVEPTQEIFEKCVAYGRLNIVYYLMEAKGFSPSLDTIKTLSNDAQLFLEIGSQQRSEELIDLLSTIFKKFDFSAVSELIRDYPMIERFLELLITCNRKEDIETLVAHGLFISNDLLSYALFSGNMEIVNYFTKIGIKPTEDMLGSLLYGHDKHFEQATFIIQQGIDPLPVFKHMCRANDSIAVRFLLKNGIMLNQELLEWVKENSPPGIKSLLFAHKIYTEREVLAKPKDLDSDSDAYIAKPPV